jgi:hypothetical protein
LSIRRLMFSRAAGWAAKCHSISGFGRRKRR